MFIRSVCFILGLLCSVTFTRDKARHNDSGMKPEIFIVGTIHSMHFNADYHYSINDLLAQVIALKPDVVCGEIAPDAFGQIMEGYYPPEAAFLAEMAPASGYRFVPVDWRLDYVTQAKADSIYPASVRDKVASFGSTYFTRMLETGSPSIYDEIHGESNIAIIDSVFEKIIGADPVAETAHGNWHERNMRIVENGLKEAKGAHRIVFVFGSDHIPQIRRQLNARGYDPRIPGRMFIPGDNNRVPDQVLDRWKRNLENLCLIRDGRITTSRDNFLKVTNSRRIKELETAIQKGS